MASQIPTKQLRNVLSNADYLRLVTLDEVRAVLGRGKPGAAKLRLVLERHEPQLARTRSELEVEFLRLRERYSLTPPDGVNVFVAGWEVDVVWYEQKVIVELDGHAGHSNPAAIERDRRRDLDLRAAGFTVLRYTWQQITQTPELVAADLRRALCRRGAAR